MSTNQLLARLRELDVTLWTEGEKLKYSAPQGVMTDELLNELTDNKKELIDLLNRVTPDNSKTGSNIKPVSMERDFPTSFSQERLLFLQQLVPDTSSYNLPLAVRLVGEIDIEALQQSLDEIVSRHESLRTRFTTRNGQHRQVIDQQQSINIDAVIVSDKDEVPVLVEEEKFLPFNLVDGPLIRCKLFIISEQEHILILTLHHITCDGWSLDILFNELNTLYTAYRENKSVQLPKLSIRYADYATWQRETLTGELLKEHLDYWLGNLKDLPEIQLPLDHARPRVPNFEGGFIVKQLPSGLVGSLTKLGETAEATQFMTFFTAFAVLMHRYCGQDDIVLGTPIANRNRTELEGIVGFFVNMLVLRTDVSGGPSFRELLARVKKTALNAYRHQELPFEKLVNELRTERDVGRNPLFQVAFALQQASLSPVKLKGLSIEPVQQHDRGASRFDLEFNLFVTENGLDIKCCYRKDLFEAPTIERMLQHYQQLLESIAANPDRSIDTVQMLKCEERHLLLQEWNNTTTAFPRDKTVHELFESQAAATAQACALVFADQQLSYAQLNARANQLAHYLQAKGVGPEVTVGLCMQPGLQMVVGLLGILKAGGAYVPLDPEYPKTRLAFMLEDARVAVLLTMSSVAELLPDFDGELVFVDTDREKIERQSAGNPLSKATAESLMYIIYTSGSTGQPKGVAVPHRGMLNLMSWHRRKYDLRPSDRATQLAGPGFDASAWELWPYLGAGASVYIVDEATRRSPQELWPWLARHGITLCFMPTPLAEAALREPLPVGLKLRTLLTGGDRLHGGLPGALPFTLVNNYGPTENTVVSSCWEVEAGAQGAPPIGRPIDNVRLYVLDSDAQLLPVGVAGELYVGGESLARGYWNRPELTAEYFVADPFSDVVGARLYRSGDRVRYRADGALEFLGRLDQQIKLRGFRIELGEIETALTQHEAVRDAVVLVRGDRSGGKVDRVGDDRAGDKRLVAYVLAEQSAVPGATLLREFLHQYLPNYMVPSVFMVLDSFPVTANGKLDRDALPAPDVEQINSEIYLAPSGQLETRIAAIWRDLLGREKVGIRDNFFDLGGHSLLMGQLQARINAKLDYRIPMLDLFQYPTIETLARHLSGQVDTASSTQKAKARIDRRNSDGSHVDVESIAVIGMAGRFPGAATLEDYWDNLVNGVESIRFFSDEELAAAGIADELIGNPRFVPAKGYLDDADLFDAAFFGYPPREAELIDPQQRIFLECSWEALERAGYDPRRYPGLIGIYAGSTTNGYATNLYSHPEIVNTSGAMQIFINSNKDFLPTRVSYKFNLRGPSVNVQSACSTSLVAVHEACKSLRERECDIALAGGISVMTPRVSGYVYQDESILSPDGHCKAFSADARGTVGGEGVGVVVLKRLLEAQQDGDLIQAVICGTAINNDGSNKVGYTAPSIEGQADVIALAQAAAGVSADSIDYIETHGTGTTLGDPIEIAALTRVFGERKSDRGQHCALGAVKTNIGHLDAAAGVAGFIKTVLALKHKKIPPSLNFTQPNLDIDFDVSPFFVNTELKPWESRDGNPRRAGVSSFGIGGTNAHVVLQQAPSAENSEPGRAWQVLPVSAKCEAALEINTSRIGNYLQQNPAASLADVSYTLRTGRGQFEYRGAAIASDNETAVTTLRGEKAGRWWTNSDVTSSPPVIFMFPGQGSQYPGMGQGLYETEAVFRDIVDHCCAQLKNHIDCDLRDLLFPAPQHEAKQIDEQLRQTLMAQCSLFVIEYALAKLWLSWGIQPVAMIGHSIGEYVAACISGVIDLDEALLLIARRGQAMEQAPAGAMLSIPLAEKLVTPYLRDDLWLSVINGHSNCVVSGCPATIEQLEQELKTDGVDAMRLHTAGAFHSGLMDAVVPQLVEAASQLNISPPGIPYLSNVTGSWIEASQLRQPQYWGQHLRNTVRFAQGVDELLEKFEHGIFLEVGPGNNLGAMVRGCAADNKTRAEILPSLRHPRESMTDGETVARALAGLWLQGVDIDWREYDRHSRRCRVELPTYPFQRQSYWVNPAVNPDTRALSTTRQSQQDWFYAPAWKSSPMIADDVRGELPGDLQGACIVFANASFSCSRIISYLRQRGAQVYCVTAGTEFSNASPSNYTINPASKTDYELLFADEELASDRITAVIHCWGLDADQGNDSSVASAVLQLGYYSLLYTMQALFESATNLSLHVNVLTQFSQAVDQDDAIVPEKSMVTSLLRVISQENIDFSYTLHDLLDEDIETRSQQQSNPGDLPVELYSMLRSSPITDRNCVLAYRRRRRWLQVYDHLSVKQTRPAETPVHLRERGVYLITGGLGRLGSVFSNYLAGKLKARLVLTTRMALPERSQWDCYLRDHDSSEKLSRIICQVQHLESVGAEVLLASVDVNDREGMRKLIDDAIAQFGEINGVIHAAGIVSGSSLASLSALTYEDCELQFTPKVYGLMVLKQLFEKYPLDFAMPVSSLSTVLGGLGLAAYSSANQFMDSLCQQQHNLGNSHWICANWDGWIFDQGGDSAMSPTSKVNSGGTSFSMSVEEGRHVFEKILNSPFVPQVIISTGDLHARLQQWVISGPDEAAKEVSDGNSYQRPPIKTPFVEPSTEIERSLCKIWQQMLGIETAGVDDDFFELGGHSLLATQLIARLRTELAMELSLENIFEAPTVRQLAAFVSSRKTPVEPSEEISRLARQIKQMTPEQHRQMLAQARARKA